VGGAEVAATVLLVPARRRKALQVDVRAAIDVLHQRSVANLADRYQRHVARLLAPGLGHLPWTKTVRQAEQPRGELLAGKGVCDQSPALGVAANLIEQQARRFALSHDQLGKAADLEVPVRAAHRLQLPQLVRAPQPVTQITTVSPAQPAPRRFGCHIRSHSLTPVPDSCQPAYEAGAADECRGARTVYSPSPNGATRGPRPGHGTPAKRTPG